MLMDALVAAKADAQPYENLITGSDASYNQPLLNEIKELHLSTDV